MTAVWTSSCENDSASSANPLEGDGRWQLPILLPSHFHNNFPELAKVRKIKDYTLNLVKNPCITFLNEGLFEDLGCLVFNGARKV